jgi:hypothetical protein
MRRPRMQFSVGRLMVAVAATALILFATCPVGFEPNAILPLAIVAAAMWVWGTREFLAVMAFAVVLSGFLSPPRYHFQGLTRRTLRFQIVEAGRRAPIAGAGVTIKHPWDSERPPIEGSTDAGGRVDLHGIFRGAGGGIGRVQPSYNVFYGPWSVTVEAEGFRKFQANLDEINWLKEEGDPPLGLREPLPPEIVIELKPAQE